MRECGGIPALKDDLPIKEVVLSELKCIKFEFWNEVEDIYLLNQIFSDCVKIGYVDLFSVDVIRDGPTVRLHFDLADSLPDRPLPHWGKPNIDYNRCRMGADCFGVSKFSMQGISIHMRMMLAIYKNDKVHSLSFSSRDANIEIQCLDLALISPSVYMDGDL